MLAFFVLVKLGPVNTNLIAPVTPTAHQFRREKRSLTSQRSDEQRQMVCFRCDPEGWAYFSRILRCCSIFWNNPISPTAPKIRKKYTPAGAIAIVLTGPKKKSLAQCLHLSF
ncbi:hypothetical protein [Agarilytica rhodophyticola]|uniref:hypothetical protein n=1 Tax=Agarilytica rhodophyticola TaxID=1737490 RepID=UPI000B347DAD|nr:hypothetical protein [Agarilytica rhodophyticola]